nr:MAG TPA: hypothetical protein [Caudoviricetes sp.]
MIILSHLVLLVNLFHKKSLTLCDNYDIILLKGGNRK